MVASDVQGRPDLNDWCVWCQYPLTLRQHGLVVTGGGKRLDSLRSFVERLTAPKHPGGKRWPV